MKETSNDYYLAEEEMKKLNKEKEELKKNTKEEDGESKIKLEKKVETAIKSLLTEKEDKEVKEKTKEKENKEDTEWKKKGFLIALNKKFIFFKKGNAEDNVMGAEEVKKFIEGLKEVAKASGTVFEEGFTYIKIGKCTIEMVHTDMVKEITKEPPQLNLPNTPSKPLNCYSPTFRDNWPLLPCGYLRDTIPGGCTGCPNMHSALCPMYNHPVPPMAGVPNF